MSISGAKITKENVAGEKIIFYPGSPAEAECLQRNLLAMGFIWSHGPTTVCNVNESLQMGLIVMDGLLYYNNTGSSAAYTVCSVKQAEKDPPVSGQPSVAEMFNSLSARLDSLSEKIDRMYNELYPSVEMTKPGLKNSKT